MSSTLSAAGLGQSTAVSIGGDAIIGQSYAELMPLFEADEATEAIVIYTEPGGRMEAQLAEWVKDNNSRLPIVAFMAGKFMDEEEMQGMSFGHAGTIVEGAEDTAAQKIARLQAAGITVVERIDEIPYMVIKKDGRREAFDRNKVMAGLLRACEKRPVPSSKLDSIVNAVEKYVQESPERERPTSKIGEQIMRRLKELDKVAYVRFASVYLEFEDVSEFMNELKTLVRARASGSLKRA
jgi:transcriptional regulator NrdR